MTTRSVVVVHPSLRDPSHPEALAAVELIRIATEAGLELNPSGIDLRLLGAVLQRVAEYYQDIYGATPAQVRVTVSLIKGGIIEFLLKFIAEGDVSDPMFQRLGLLVSIFYSPETGRVYFLRGCMYVAYPLGHRRTLSRWSLQDRKGKPLAVSRAERPRGPP